MKIQRNVCPTEGSQTCSLTESPPGRAWNCFDAPASFPCRRERPRAASAMSRVALHEAVKGAVDPLDLVEEGLLERDGDPVVRPAVAVPDPARDLNGRMTPKKK